MANPVLRSECPGGTEISWGRINDRQREHQQSTSLLHEKVITSVILGGGCADPQLTKRGSTVNFHFCMKRQLVLLILGGSAIDKEKINSQFSHLHEKVITSVDSGGGGSMIDREDQQSTFTFA